MQLEDRIALECFRRFDALPRKSKPGIDADGRALWVPLSGIVVATQGKGCDEDVECVALGTGMKCLPAAKAKRAGGVVLHDWHAEILAVRSFNSLLLHECLDLMQNEFQSPLLRRRRTDELEAGAQPFAIRDDVRIYLYCSEAPCGDASMELVMQAQADPTPWPTDDGTPNLQGRGNFSQLGTVRRKPARADSPQTLSKSCSDKLALKQCTSLLSSLPSLLVSPENAYLSAVVLPQSQFVEDACRRSFSTRLSSLKGRAWPGGYSFSPFEAKATSREFAFSRRRAGPGSSNVSALWHLKASETLVNGVLQGKKAGDPRGACASSRMAFWVTAAKVASLLALPALEKALAADLYSQVKGDSLLSDRRRVKAEAKETLKGWIPNEPGDFAR